MRATQKAYFKRAHVSLKTGVQSKESVRTFWIKCAHVFFSAF